MRSGTASKHPPEPILRGLIPANNGSGSGVYYFILYQLPRDFDILLPAAPESCPFLRAVLYEFKTMHYQHLFSLFCVVEPRFASGKPSAFRLEWMENLPETAHSSFQKHIRVKILIIIHKHFRCYRYLISRKLLIDKPGQIQKA